MLIRHEVHVRAPVARCFDLTRSIDLHADSSTDIAARAVGGRRSGLSGPGDTTVWSARFFGLRFRLTTLIENFSPPDHFADRMTHGLLRRFSHVYHCRPLPDGGCALADELTVEAPFGPLGRLLERLYLKRRLRHLVRRRLEAIKTVAEGDGWHRYLPGPSTTPPPISNPPHNGH